MIWGMNGFNEGKRVYRTRDGRIAAGVCSGLSAYFGVDAVLVRLVFVVLTVFGGMGAVLYLCAWAIIPEEGESASIVENLINKKRDDG
jgi:phage shock protein PspC (stress-responsive transcriptional regulator)